MKIFLMAIFISIFAGFALGQDEDLSDFDYVGATNEGESKTYAVHLEILNRWIGVNGNWRPAKDSDSDMEKWSDSTEFLGPSFYVVGDFNEDNEIDFGLVLVSKSGKKSFSAVIFNGPFNPKKKQQPALYIPKFPPNHGLSDPDSYLCIFNFVTDKKGFDIVASGNSYKIKKVE